MSDDVTGMTDVVEITANDVAVLTLATDAKGPVEFYVQAYETPGGKHTFRVVDRYGEVMSPIRRDKFETAKEAAAAAKSAAKEIDATTEVEAYPGASGGPHLPTESEGDEE